MQQPVNISITSPFGLMQGKLRFSSGRNKGDWGRWPALCVVQAGVRKQCPPRFCSFCPLGAPVLGAVWPSAVNDREAPTPLKQPYSAPTRRPTGSKDFFFLNLKEETNLTPVKQGGILGSLYFFIENFNNSILKKQAFKITDNLIRFQPHGPCRRPRRQPPNLRVLCRVSSASGVRSPRREDRRFGGNALADRCPPCFQ